MSWHDRLCVDPSRMELEIVKELQKKKLSDKFQREYVIVFYSDKTCETIWRSRLTIDMVKRSTCYCFPDFLHFGLNGIIYFGIDGSRHLTPHNSKRDNKQNRFMNALRIKYVRFPYKRYTVRKRNEIVKAMIMFMENPDLVGN